MILTEKGKMLVTRICFRCHNIFCSSKGRHHLLYINPFPDDKFLDSSKPKEFADYNFSFDEKGRKFSKQVENTVGKGEIARYKQFLLFPQCFQKFCNVDP